MTKFEEIVRAWRSRWRPTEAEAALAERRLAICATCPSRKEIIKGSDFFVFKKKQNNVNKFFEIHTIEKYSVGLNPAPENK